MVEWPHRVQRPTRPLTTSSTRQPRHTTCLVVRSMCQLSFVAPTVRFVVFFSNPYPSRCTGPIVMTGRAQWFCRPFLVMNMFSSPRAPHATRGCLMDFTIPSKRSSNETPSHRCCPWCGRTAFAMLCSMVQFCARLEGDLTLRRGRLPWFVKGKPPNTIITHTHPPACLFLERAIDLLCFVFSICRSVFHFSLCIGFFFFWQHV